MRKARSVAWSSTAGFHQRSKWNTWLARVRLRPVPPSFREDEEQRSIALLEAAHHFGAFSGRSATVEELHADPETLGEYDLQQRAHLLVLGEDEAPVSYTQGLLQQLQQAEELSAALDPGGGFVPFVQELRRVVADLLEPGEHRQNEPLALYALALWQVL